MMMAHQNRILLKLVAIFLLFQLSTLTAIANPLLGIGPPSHPFPPYVSHLDLVTELPDAPAPIPDPIIFASFLDATLGGNWHWETEIANLGASFQNSSLTFYLPGGGTITGSLSLEEGESFYIDIILAEVPEVAFWTWFGLNAALPDILLSMDTAVSEIDGVDPTGHDPGPLNPMDFLIADLSFTGGGSFNDVVFGTSASPIGEQSFGVLSGTLLEPSPLILFSTCLIGLMISRRRT